MRVDLVNCESKESQAEQLKLTGIKKKMFLQGFRLQVIIEILGGVK